MVVSSVITGVVLARNEELNIVDCMRTLRPHVGEIQLVDMESTDRTVELAKPFVTRVLTHPLVGAFDAARNVAISEARHDWLWFLDADERIPNRTGQLVNELVRQRGHEISAITIPFKSYFCNKWIQNCGWWPGYTMPRVLKRGYFRFSEQLHGGVQFQGRELRLPPDPELAIEHFSYRSIEHYIEKFNRYTSVESDQLATLGTPLSWESAFRSMVRDWWQYYEGQRGIHEGQHGWILSWLAGQYRWFSQAKLLDRQAPTLDYHVVPSLDGIISTIRSEVSRQRAAGPALPLGIVWRSPVWDPSGYAEDSRIHLKSLATGDRPVALHEIHWSDTSCPLADADVALFKALNRVERPKFTAAITSCIPSLVQPDPDAALNILRTTFETDRIPEAWLPVIEMFDEVWVFSQHNRDSFRSAGVAPEKLRVLGSYVDTSVFTSKGGKYKLPKSFRAEFLFLSIFDWQLRKGWDLLLRAYCQEFPLDFKTGLLLKVTTAHGHSPQMIQEQVTRILTSLGSPHRPDILIMHEQLRADELAALYRSANAFVLPSRGEGWGRPYMEAMACGLPTIGTRGSGNLDFMNDENSFLVAAKQVAVPAEAVAEIPVYDGHRWLEPDIADLRQKMRTVYEDGRLRKRVAKQAVASIREKFDIRCARNAVESNLRQAEERFCVRPLPPVQQTDIGVQLEGELFAGHSFSNVNEKLVMHLSSQKGIGLSFHRVRNNPTFDRDAPHAAEIKPYLSRILPTSPQVVVRHAFPPNWDPPVQGKWVQIQPWEFGALPLDWIESLRDRVDEIWAPSSYVKRVYQRSGIPGDKIHVIPWGVSQEVFHPRVPPRILMSDKTFRFLFVGGTIARKGIDLLLAAYTQEFRPDEDVCLVIKDMGTRSFYRYGNYREQVLRLAGDENLAQILYFDQNMTEGQLASLYTACNCLAAPYRGEGFGLPILETMACGLCPIVPRGGASDDFVSEETGFLLPANDVECTHDWRLCGVPTEIAIGVPALRETLRHAFQEREQTSERGERASDRVRKNYTWDKTAALMAERITALAGEAGELRNRVAVPRAPTVTLCVLMRNDERYIGDCLGRLRPYVDEIVAINIGSEDRSKLIALEYGARVYQDGWKSDYALSRNLAIVRATSDWILFLDPCDLVDDPPARKIKSLLQSQPSTVIGINVRVYNGELAKPETRLFRNQNGLVYELRGGEHLRAAIHRLHGQIIESEIEIRCAVPSSQAELQERRTLLHQDLTERPGDPQVVLALALNHYRDGNYFHGECYLHEFLKSAVKQHPDFLLASRLLVTSHRRKGDLHRALEATEAALREFPNDDGLAHERDELRALIGGHR